MAEINPAAASAELNSQAPVPAGPGSATDEDEELPPFNSSECLFCNLASDSLDDNVSHMRRAHGLFIPDDDRLIVKVETLLRYLHLVVFGYFECLACGTQRASAEAVQQHMLGKGHCWIDISSQGSEYADFYDESSSGSGRSDSDETDDEGDGENEGEGGKQEKQSGKRIATGHANSSSARVVDDSSLILPSGKVLSHRSAPRQSRPHRLQNALSRSGEADANRAGIDSDQSPELTSTDLVQLDSSAESGSRTTALTRAEKRDLSFNTELSRLSASDRNALVHLPAYQQRAILATQKKQASKAQRAERRYQSRLEGMGNRTLMKHFVNDVPGRQLG